MLKSAKKWQYFALWKYVWTGTLNMLQILAKMLIFLFIVRSKYEAKILHFASFWNCPKVNAKGEIFFSEQFTKTFLQYLKNSQHKYTLLFHILLNCSQTSLISNIPQIFGRLFFLYLYENTKAGAKSEKIDKKVGE